MIRLMEEQDVHFVNEVRNECREWLHNCAKFSYEQTLKWFSEKKDPYYIYELDGEKIGYFRTSNWHGDTCWVGMDIHKEHRGQKLAARGYQEFFSLLSSQHGIMRFKLEVLEANQRAYGLYVKLGFKEISRSDCARGVSICMEKKYDKS